jgi:hypothetical protein
VSEASDAHVNTNCKHLTNWNTRTYGKQSSSWFQTSSFLRVTSPSIPSQVVSLLPVLSAVTPCSWFKVYGEFRIRVRNKIPCILWLL